jgi:sulfite exporter TauE/SafE
MPNLVLVFTTGLLAGGVSCAAVQGGLLTAAVAGREESAGFGDVVVFLAAKLAAYIFLGLGLGLLGSVLQLTPGVTSILQIFAGLFMIAIGLSMLDVHPFFRRFVIRTPRFIGRRIRETARGGDRFAPVALGAATVFIPCGTTQAMMALAVSSASPLAGAAVMGTFVAGTAPVFMGLGLALVKLGETISGKFSKIAATIVITVGIFSLNSGLVVANSPVTAQKLWAGLECSISFCPDRVVGGDPADEVTITITGNRYLVDNPVVKAGSKVKLNIVNKSGYGCIQAMNFPALGIAKVVPPGQSEQLQIDVPDKPGELAFSCSMGMYSGQLTIVD